MLRLRTFGGLSAEPDTRSGRSAQRKRLALLAVLAVQRHRPVSRERLLGLFWPDRAAAEGRHALAQLVYAVRRDYAGDLLISGADDLRTNPDEFRADVIDFLDAVAGDDLEAATRCCTGVFLDGFYLNGVPDFERWVDQTRADLARRHATVLDTLAHTAAATGHADQALRWWRRRSEVATLDGAAIVELMRAAVQAGDAAAALRYAAEHQSRLHSELDAPPDPRIAALETEIRAAFVARPTPILPPPAAFDAEPRAQPVDDTSRGHGGSPPGRPRVRRRRWSIAIGALSLPLLAVAGWTASRAMSRPPGPPRLVVLGAIDGPDSALDLAVKEALRSGLEADPGIRVLGEARVNETLRLMARPTDTRIDGPVAREIALRRGAAIAVVGSAVPVGTGLEIVVRVINPATGQGRRTLADHAATADGALPALMRVRESIRHEALGVAATARLDPLPPVMTSSLVALQDYAQARIALTRSDPDRAFRLAAAALDEDSLFPMANYMVGDLDWFRDHQRSAELHLTRGLALRDRLPLR
ncbi:MAG: AfsR/SARP family transcriptional regulator, partial [Gemmatimonadales bacterium]